MNSQNKNKIYAFVSISVIILTVASFAATVGFLLKINKLVFNVDEKIIKEQTTVLNKEGFERIKNKLNPQKNNIITEEKSINIDASGGSADVFSSPDLSPNSNVSLSPEVTPASEPEER